MFRRTFKVELLIVTLLLAVIGLLLFRMLNQSARPQVVWTFRNGQRRQPVAVDETGIVYTGSVNGHVYAVGPAGRELWKCRLGAPARSGVFLSPEGLLYTHDSLGFLYCLDKTGKLLWSFNAGDTRNKNFIAPVNGRLYLASLSGGLRAFSSSGKVLWQFGVGGYFLNQPYLSAKGNVYVVQRGLDGSPGVLHCISPAGVELWHFALASSNDSEVLITPEGNIWITDGQDLILLGYEGDELQRHFVGHFGNPLLRKDGSICGYSGQEFVCFDQKGNEKWRRELIGGKITILSTDQAIEDASGNIYLAFSYDRPPSLTQIITFRMRKPAAHYSIPGRAMALDQNGKILWVYESSESLKCTPAIGPDGTVYVSNHLHELLALRPPAD